MLASQSQTKYLKLSRPGLDCEEMMLVDCYNAGCNVTQKKLDWNREHMKTHVECICACCRLTMWLHHRTGSRSFLVPKRYLSKPAASTSQSHRASRRTPPSVLLFGWCQQVSFVRIIYGKSTRQSLKHLIHDPCYLLASHLPNFCKTKSNRGLPIRYWLLVGFMTSQIVNGKWNNNIILIWPNPKPMHIHVKKDWWLMDVNLH